MYRDDSLKDLICVKYMSPYCYCSFSVSFFFIKSHKGKILKMIQVLSVEGVSICAFTHVTTIPQTIQRILPSHSSLMATPTGNNCSVF